jgi:sugar/nucleoside kinase (ribokinase family)
MTPDAPRLDLLVVGALTVDRFADGSAAPGGSVLHICRVAAPRGLSVGVVTAAGPEPEAVAAMAELRELAALVDGSEQPATISFRHRDAPEGRRLWLGRRGDPVRPSSETRDEVKANALLFAPVAGEVPAEVLGWHAGRARGAILQGWLRSLEEGEEVQPLPLAAVPEPVTDALRDFDLLVASREDLLAEGADPRVQLEAVRGAIGSGPTVVLTDGPDGAWIDPSRSARNVEPIRVAVPRRVGGVSSVGAGDVLTAFMLAGEWRRPITTGFLLGRARLAMAVVVDVLEERRRS